MGLLTRLLSVLLLSVALASCGEDEPGGPDAQPTPDQTVFGPGLFDQLPHPGGSEPVGPKTQEQGVVARSYKLDNAVPSEVMDFYEDALADDWRLIDPVEQIGPAENPTYRGQWRRGEWVLIVTASAAPTLKGTAPGETRDPTVQYSLSLEPIAREGTPLTETTG